MMAQRAQAQEADLWALAGLTPGARVADVGCGPGAMVATLAETVGPGGHVVGVDGDEQAVETAHALLAAAAVTNAEVQAGQAQTPGWLKHPSTPWCCATCWPTTAAPNSASSTTSHGWSAPAATSTWWTST
jgi:predicted methyltransferase